MSSGMHGEGGNPGIVNGINQKLDPVPRPAEPLDQDTSALRTPMWTKPGGGYSYASASPHIASIVLRHLTGMEMQQYIEEKLARPMGFGPWGYALHRNGNTLPHTPGGGSIALRATDAVRLPYLLLHQGKWGDQQLVPAEYVAMCGRPSPYNPHSPMGLMFEAECRRPRVRRAARCVFQVRRGRVGHLHRAVARSGDVQDGRQRRAVQSGAHRACRWATSWIIRATTGSRCPTISSMMVRWAAMMAFAGCWRWWWPPWCSRTAG